jgi:hypothetical protein
MRYLMDLNVVGRLTSLLPVLALEPSAFKRRRATQNAG